MFNKPNYDQYASLLSKSSLLAQTLGVIKFIIVKDMIWSHFVLPLKSDLDVQQTTYVPPVLL
jgi:hypothetical protein